MSNVKSLSVAAIFDKKTVKENLNKPLVQITGVVTDYIVVKTKFGDQYGLKGAFIGMNLLTGEFVESEAAFITGQETNKIVDTVKDLNAKNEVVNIQLDIQIGATESDKNPHGYAWIAFSEQSEQTKSYISAVRERMEKKAAEIKALPAPKKGK